MKNTDLLLQANKEININEFSILLEPIGRNTAPAITVAALKALEKILILH